MRKNVAGQLVAGKLVSRIDGSPITSGATILCAQDDSAELAGVGALTHKGGGDWAYHPTQGETNGNHVIFSFGGPNAIGQLVQIYTIGYDPQNPGFGGGGGTGAYQVTVTVQDQAANRLQNAEVRLVEGINVRSLLTDVDGHATFGVNAATYQVNVHKDGYDFTPTTRTVTGDNAGTLVNPLVMTLNVIPSPSNLNLCRIYGTVQLPNAQPAADMKIKFTLGHPDPIKAEHLIARRPVTCFTDATGTITDGIGNDWVELIRNDKMIPEGSHYVVSSGDLGFRDFELVINTPTLDLSTVIPVE